MMATVHSFIRYWLQPEKWLIIVIIVSFAHKKVTIVCQFVPVWMTTVVKLNSLAVSLCFNSILAS